MAAPLFGFVQAEFPWELGPADGRYVLRGHAGVTSHVLVLTTLGAVERRRRVGRRSRARAAEGEPAPVEVPTARATLIRADPFEAGGAAERWLAAVDRDAEVGEAMAVLNRVLHAQRTAAADPFVREVRRAQALVVRVGIGEGEQVAHGRWLQAAQLAPTAVSAAASRAAGVLRPQERLAAVLGGRDVALACEELTLRARIDLDAGRTREAALQLRVAFEAALSELRPWADRPGMANRLNDLGADRAVVGDLANAAIQGGLDDAQAADLTDVLGALEAALRARTTIALQ